MRLTQSLWVLVFLIPFSTLEVVTCPFNFKPRNYGNLPTVTQFAHREGAVPVDLCFGRLGQLSFITVKSFFAAGVATILKVYPIVRKFWKNGRKHGPVHMVVFLPSVLECCSLSGAAQAVVAGDRTNHPQLQGALGHAISLV